MTRYEEDNAATAKLLHASDTDGLFERFLTALGFDPIEDGWRWLADNVILAGRASRQQQRLVRVAGRVGADRARQLEVESHIVGGLAVALYAFELRAQGTELGDL
jgi:hypothetical protein